MISEADNDTLLRRYLLGELSEQEEMQLETEYLANAEALEQLLVVEDELVDAYLRGELTASQGGRLERRFLASPRGRERLAFASTWMRTVSEASRDRAPTSAQQERPSWWQSMVAFVSSLNAATRFAIATAALVVVLSGLWLIVGSLRGGRDQEQAQRQDERDQSRPLGLANQQQQSPVEEPAANQTAPSERPAQREQARRNIASFALIPSVRDIDEPQKLVLGREINQVQLQLELEADNYQSYGAVLLGPEDQEIWRQSTLKARRAKTGRAVVLRLPAKILSNGDYTLMLSGATDEGDTKYVSAYSFRIVKK